MNFLPTQLGALTALTGNWTQTQLPRKQQCNHYTINAWFVPSYIWFIAPTLCMVLKHGECKILYYLFWCTWEFQMDSRWWRQVVAAGGGGGTCNSSVDTLELDCEPRTSCSISSTNWTNDSSFAFSSNKSLLCLDVVLQFVHLPTRMRNIYLKYPLHVPLVLILRWMEQIKERHIIVWAKSNHNTLFSKISWRSTCWDLALSRVSVLTTLYVMPHFGEVLNVP